MYEGHMVDSPLLIGFVVLVVLMLTVVLMGAFGAADRFMFVLQLAFVCAAASAVWGAMNELAMTEYAVWTMYAVGVSLAVLMILRSHQKDPPHEVDESKLP
ncbi:hypothetical protein [Comamonas antarctica]|uniref:Uncharacterized protein n=1 Tax=Comamonas antarctica TaxID=2743470 RepID=A0A6N1X0W8_9BURK|nr:hypothetical protein [Comamonas antarctica]QKV52618.1 hypothetical protein HUK68_06715 [Comamonas antarctica]